MTQRPAFDPTDVSDMMADMFRRQVGEMAYTAHDAGMFKELSPQAQLSCFVAGVLTGLIGVCFSSIEPAGRNEVMKSIKRYLPSARENAEGIISSGVHGETKRAGEE